MIHMMLDFSNISILVSSIISNADITSDVTSCFTHKYIYFPS